MTGRAIQWMAIFMVASLILTVGAWAAELMRIDELKAQLGAPGVAVIDVRSPHDWEGSDRMIEGARRLHPGDNGWVLALPRDQTLVFYCT